MKSQLRGLTVTQQTIGLIWEDFEVSQKANSSLNKTALVKFYFGKQREKQSNVDSCRWRKASSRLVTFLRHKILYIRWIKPNALYMHVNNILLSDECVSFARVSSTWKTLKWTHLRFYGMLCKPAKWGQRVRQGTPVKVEVSPQSLLSSMSPFLGYYFPNGKWGYCQGPMNSVCFICSRFIGQISF